MLADLVKRNRSFRRFDTAHKIEKDDLLEFIDLTRYCASGANRQPLKYLISCDTATNGIIFPCLHWAGYLKEWAGPNETERPSAYIIILGDKSISDNFGCDHGIAAQTILLSAVEMGLGGCMIASIDKKMLRNSIQLDDVYEILLVIALGKPNEFVVIEEIEKDGDIKYWRDNRKIHHVPKRKLEDIVIKTA